VRDTTQQTQGLYRKFLVERTDGRSSPGLKHHGCSYFVLDLDHDPHAWRALEGYVASLTAKGEYPVLAQELALVAEKLRKKEKK